MINFFFFVVVFVFIYIIMQIHRSVANCRLQLTSHGPSLLGGQTFNPGRNYAIMPFGDFSSKHLLGMRIEGMTYSNKLRHRLKAQILEGRSRNEAGGKLDERGTKIQVSVHHLSSIKMTTRS